MAKTRRYAAFLRGVTPMNLKMADLRDCLQAAGLSEVRTLLASGNVVFGGASMPTAKLERKLESIMEAELGRKFGTFVRSIDVLRKLVEEDPYQQLKPKPKAKRVVTFLRAAPGAKLRFPIQEDGASILGIRGLEVFSAYLPGPRGPVFMSLLQRTFGDNITTRTWDTLKKVVADQLFLR